MLTLSDIDFIDQFKQTFDFNIKQIIIVRDLNIKAKLQIEIKNNASIFIILQSSYRTRNLL